MQTSARAGVVGTLAVVVTLAAALVGCGGGETTGDVVAPAPTTAAPASTATADSAPARLPAVDTTVAAPTTTAAVADTVLAPDPEELDPEWMPRGTARVAYAVGERLAIYDEPNGRAAWNLPNPTQFGGPRVTVILDTWQDWYLVSVPVRPNATTGWVRAADVRIEEHEFRARVNLSTRRVVVWDGDDLVADSGAVIGTSSTPTPVGTFYVRDKIAKSNGGGAYGPWILALSGFSEVLETFDGGLPAIALHGTNRPDLIGGAHSNGCIRLPNDVIELLAEQVPLGTPVEIVS